MTTPVSGPAEAINRPSTSVAWLPHFLVVAQEGGCAGKALVGRHQPAAKSASRSSPEPAASGPGDFHRPPLPGLIPTCRATRCRTTTRAGSAALGAGRCVIHRGVRRPRSPPITPDAGHRDCVDAVANSIKNVKVSMAVAGAHLRRISAPRRQPRHDSAFRAGWRHTPPMIELRSAVHRRRRIQRRRLHQPEFDAALAAAEAATRLTLTRTHELVNDAQRILFHGHAVPPGITSVSVVASQQRHCHLEWSARLREHRRAPDMGWYVARRVAVMVPARGTAGIYGIVCRPVTCRAGGRPLRGGRKAAFALPPRRSARAICAILWRNFCTV